MYVLVGSKGPWTPTGLGRADADAAVDRPVSGCAGSRRREHAERIPNPDDRRSYLVRLTPAGEPLLARCEAAFSALAEGVEAALGGKKVGELRAGLSALRQAIGTEIG